MSKFYFFVSVFFCTLFGVLIVEILIIPALISAPFFQKIKFFERLRKEVILNPVQEVVVSEKELIPKIFSDTNQGVILIGPQENKLRCAMPITSDGIILVKKDFIDFNNLTLYFNGAKEKVKILKSDPKTNFVLIKLEKYNLKTVPFLENKNLSLGSSVFLVGKNSQETIINVGNVRSVEDNLISLNLNEKGDFVSCPIFTLKGELIGLVESFNDNITRVLPIWTLRENLGF
jgi:S1-C subfamily serine protease